MYGWIAHDRLPECVGCQVLWKGFEEDSVIDPDKVQPRILRDDDLPALDYLSMQRGDIAAILLRHPPEFARHRFEVVGPDFLANELEQSLMVAQVDTWIARQVTQRCITIVTELMVFKKGT